MDSSFATEWASGWETTPCQRIILTASPPTRRVAPQNEEKRFSSDNKRPILKHNCASLPEWRTLVL